ncbi:pyruvate dehydrogenase complex dihydrolipoamide acetyltransferase [Sphingomonas koreensis]|jgi:pyruvate dehydrogenase E2 component (dihydrolipoamide acetyltransferase)|uniref:Acetyltransferase component of pyruvate dehydrogenase complex n=1 Tax=Sphingomonas koreensis TaxID=93064 RepID=A0A1L6JDU7_9SPHN|nr:pyruvate dehydrogenase complex dihydrolipoamide acetyltransferase [Sphingomonas koreensis]APR54068.1 pyruvate dehydrogenase complex dihydrolipoamide acetyltransferase [Sphingomonas koreensis]MDC7809043.1 pyruvate dehydrogenase complex dihydrolipoamide acetyltransferase [Sphingomonas koreensis]PJI90378.1 pyruvate dehydrogenase E2 component (dihydrolipoamide acetyltransferase) [Sphingomonas koreensis]RSU18702.1 pyruvate dehydrogenase complex dihydrolipoamide acetyltransferase [Sphingomonas kor
MSIDIKMPALSPTMEEGTLAKWLVKEGDTVKAGDLMAEIETDKATMEFEAVDEGVIAKILIAEGTDGVKVGTVIAVLAGEGEDVSAAAAAPKAEAPKAAEAPKEEAKAAPAAAPAPVAAPAAASGDRVKASPLARRIAAEKGVELGSVSGSGPNGRIVKADVEGAKPGAAPAAAAPAAPAAAPAAAAPAAPASVWYDESIPHEEEKLSNIRKTIARRLTEAKQTIPHIYLTVDVQLDALLKLRGQLNKSLEARGVKLSVNDMLIKALAVALAQVPKCNVTYAGDKLVKYSRSDISVAVSTPTGLITPIIRDAANIGLASISTQMKELGQRAKEGKLQPHEYQGGTASISNMGMFGIKQFDAVINPPQAMILAVGAGEKRPYIVDDALGVATVMSATGSFDHRAVDGADGAELMKVFKALVESPMGLLA